MSAGIMGIVMRVGDCHSLVLLLKTAKLCQILPIYCKICNYVKIVTLPKKPIK